MILKASQSRVDLAVMSLHSRHKAEQVADWKVNQQRMMDGYKAVLKKER